MNRLFETLYILLNKNTVTAKELAEHFGVSQRTVYRDVDALGLAGIPVRTEKGKGGGISLMPDFVLSRSILSEREQHEILSAVHGLGGIRTADTNLVLQKLSAVFNKSAVNWLETDFSGWDSSDGMFDDLKAAILERRIVGFDYYGASGDKTRRRVEPVRLCFKSRAWYLRAFCLARQDIRLFKLLRIRNLAATEERFAERDPRALPPDPGPAKPSVTLKLKIAPEMTYRIHDEFDDGMVERHGDGGFVVTATYPEDDWVYGLVLSFGEHVEVLEPEHLRQVIGKKAKKIAEKY